MVVGFGYGNDAHNYNTVDQIAGKTPEVQLMDYIHVAPRTITSKEVETRSRAEQITAQRKQDDIDQANEAESLRFKRDVPNVLDAGRFTYIVKDNKTGKTSIVEPYNEGTKRGVTLVEKVPTRGGAINVSSISHEKLKGKVDISKVFGAEESLMMDATAAHQAIKDKHDLYRQLTKCVHA